MGRLLRVALACLGVALIIPAAGAPRPLDGTHAAPQPAFLATCDPGVDACFDLAVSQGDLPDPVPAGNRITYQIVVQNHGPDDATDVTMTDFLPVGTDPASVQIDTGSPADPTVDCSYEPPVPVSFANPGQVNCFYATLDNTDLHHDARRIDISFSYSPDNPPPYPTTIVNNLQIGADCNCKELNPPTNAAHEPTTVTSPGDIKITKTHGGNAAPDTNLGNPQMPVENNFTWLVRIDNTADAATPAPTGTSGAAWTVDNPLTVNDTLPPGFEFLGTTNANVDDCTSTPATLDQPSTVTCHPQVSIPAKGSYDLNLIVRPIVTSTLPYTNTVSGTKFGDGTPALITPGDDSSADRARIICPVPGTRREPFLCLTKTDGEPPASLRQGKAFTYTLGIINERTGADQGFTDPLTVTDQIPAGMTVLSASTNGPGGCTVLGTLLTCTLQPLPSGDTVPPTTPSTPAPQRVIKVTVITNNTGTFANVACIGTITSPPPGIPITEGLGPCATEQSIVTGAGDLTLQKQVKPQGSPDSAFVSTLPVNFGDTVVYRLTVVNKGPATMPAVVLTDPIPAEVDFVSANPGSPTCSFTAPNVVCKLGDMKPGAKVVVLVTATVTGPNPPTATRTYTNTANVTSDQSASAPIELTPADNTASATITASSADLSITKTASPGTAGVGQQVTYTLVVANAGPGSAAGVTVKDPLPGALSFATATTTQGTCTGTQTVTCSLGTIANGASATITIRATPTAPGTFTNTASVTSVSKDPSNANNSSSVTTRVIAADLTISKVASPSPVSVGITLTYTVKVKNLGPDAATGVTISDTLPSQVTLPSSTPSQGTCFGNPTVTCALGNLAPNATATVTIAVTPIVPDVTITNTAQVTSSFDLNAGNNSASVSTQVRQPRLKVTPTVVTPGQVPLAIGTNFPPNAPVQLHWSRGLGKRGVVTNAQGAFRVPMLVLPRDIQGPRVLVATSLDPTVPALAFLDETSPPSLLVGSGSGQPIQVKPKFPVTKIVSRGG